LSEENKRLLGLQNSEESTKELNRDSFISDFHEINKILQDLNKEVSIIVKINKKIA
jgi:hypothetical protein